MGNMSDSLAGKTDDILKFASDIVAAYVSNNPIPVSEIPHMIKSIHSTLGGLATGMPGEVATTQKPAVNVKKSITPEYVICLEDGKKLKMLKRYLRSRYGLSPEGYRAKWGLPADYPMVAPNYGFAALFFEDVEKLFRGVAFQHRAGRRCRSDDARFRACFGIDRRHLHDIPLHHKFDQNLAARAVGFARRHDPQAARARRCAVHTVSSARTRSRIISSVWNGDGVNRSRSVPRGTVGKLIGCT